MSRTFSKAELIKNSKKVFKTYPKAESLFATNDGQFFLEENRAQLHAKSYKDGKYFEIENENLSADDNSGSSEPASADDLIKAAKDLSLDDAKAALESEQKGKKRKTVIKAYNDRIEELNKGE